MHLKSEVKQTFIFLAVFLVYTTMISFCFLIEEYFGFGLISFSEAGPSYKYRIAFNSKIFLPLSPRLAYPAFSVILLWPSKDYYLVSWPSSSSLL